MPLISDGALDDLLQYVIDNSEDLHLCSDEPTNYTEATSTYTLGDKQSVSLSSQGDMTPNGRKVTVSGFADGDATATGSATHWALVDVTGTELIATGELDDAESLTSGSTFSISAFDIGVTDPDYF